MAFVIQLILPTYDNNGQLFPAELSKQVRIELTDKFGGLTAYTRAPAEGTWRDEEGKTQRDDIVIVEVMTPSLDREWWTRYARDVATRFEQKELVVRAMEFHDLTARNPA